MAYSRMILAMLLGGSLFGTHRAYCAVAPCAPDTLVRTIPNPDPVMDDHFGDAVAISGTIAVIGASRDRVQGVPGVGTAYVYDPINGNLISTLINPEPDMDDLFGSTVAISGQLAAVGAFLDNPGTIPLGYNNAGSVYIFNASTGVLQRALTRPVLVQGDVFGCAVALSGNLLVVGAYGVDVGADQEVGEAYVFNPATGDLVSTLHHPEPTAGNSFGAAVAISGNLAVVGAPEADIGLIDRAGKAYVFNATTGVLTATLTNPAPTEAGHFGSSVAVSGNRVVVSMYGADPGGIMDAGRAYIFDATTGALLLALDSPEPTEAQLFSVALAMEGNIVLVGVPHYDIGPDNEAGKCYLFNATTGGLISSLANPSPQGDYLGGDYFGASVALSGNIALAGALLDDIAVPFDSGSASVFICRVNAAEGWSLYE